MPSLSKDCPKRRAESDPEGEPPIKKLELLHLGPTAFQDDEQQKRNELTDSDSMFLDDTAHTSYIYDIEKELASIEEQEKQISFLPEVERRLNAVPKSLLRDPKPDNNELVLYRVPHSLTVTEDQDNVRKAIIESRARARARQSQSTESSTHPASVVSSFSNKQGDAALVLEADDCMDVDS